VTFVAIVTVLPGFMNSIFSKGYTQPINTTDDDNTMNDDTVLNSTEKKKGERWGPSHAAKL
jgi:hypothetical protein